jgi:Skp family chaperone for outer membrane proteins
MMINLAKATLLTLLLALSFPMQTSAQTTAANNAPTAASIPRKADGSVDFDKWFEGKNIDQQYEMADLLTDLKDEKAFTKYMVPYRKKLEAENTKNRAEGAKIQAENTKNRAEGAKIQAENTKLDAIIAALATIEALGKKLQRGEQITDADKANLKIAINTPGVNPNLIMGIKKHINVD